MTASKIRPGIATAFRNKDYETEIDRLKRSGGTGSGGGDGTPGPIGPQGPAGPAGPPGVVEIYEQLAEPVTSTIGAIWIEQEPL
jgi:hypothetical protein